MKKYLLLLVATFSMSMFVGCDFDEDLEPLSYATFERGPLSVGVDIDGSRTYDVTVFTGNVVGSDRTIDVTVDASSTLDAAAYSVPATVTIPANSNEGTLTIDVSDVNIGATGETLVLNLVPTSELSVGSGITLNVRTVCPEGTTEVMLSFIFDGYASETTWEITDADGTVVYEGGGFADGDETFMMPVCLSSGDYTFTIYDVYGDGLSYPEAGSVTLSANGTELGSIEGDFGFDDSFDFTIN
ncbi:hypothetical protein [Salinimicrobium sp. HB62]|uniref:hypothetical protein n=1 Tax=Salinimicrobium sp. HB62 TaxID=3077781 RepID=UPI002D79D746|nr:hypothetical protein [Salinimicrobium sp. HB62]